LTLLCEPSEGSPKPEVTWFVGDGLRGQAEEARGQVRKGDATVLEVVVTRQDNEREYR